MYPPHATEPVPEFDRVLDDYQRQLRGGDGLSVESYATKFPHLADRIREVFPVVAALELTAAQPPSARATRLGDYRILREIGRGGMGVVYEAVQESLGRRVAVKVFPAVHLGRADLRERFEREAKAAGRLHHTHIVPVFGVGDEGGVPFFAMQFIEGVGLDRVVAAVRAARRVPELTPGGAADLTTPKLIEVARPAPVPPTLAGQTGPAYFRTAARLMLEAAEALAHAHDHGVQHRDIKPSNLLVDATGSLWMTDFGLAKLDDGANLTATGDQIGTLRYAPPERFRGAADERADLYSLGATFYELLTLRPAFPETDPLVLVDRIKTVIPPAPSLVNSSVPRDLDTICRKCLEKEPGWRYQTAEALATDLRAFLDGRPITTRRVGLVEAAVKWVKRKPVTTTVLTGLMLAGLVAAGAMIARERERQIDRAAGRVMTIQRAAIGELPPLIAELDDPRVRAGLVPLAARPITDRAGLNSRLALLGDDPHYADEVADHLLVCTVDQLLPIRQIASRYLGSHRERFWRVLLDPKADSSIRVRAAGVLAVQMPDDPRWDAIAVPLADMLAVADPVELGALARAVAPVLPRLVEALKLRYENERQQIEGSPVVVPNKLAGQVGRMNTAAVLLGQTLTDRPDVVAWLLATGEDAHLGPPLAAVQRTPHQLAPYLRQVVDDPADGLEVPRRKAGAAAALMAVAGPDDPVWTLFRWTADPTTRSHLIRRVEPAGVPPGSLTRRFAAESDVSCKRALLLALGEYPADRLPAGFVTSVIGLYSTHADPGLHAAAGWALRHRWGQAAIVDQIDRERAEDRRADRGWFVAPHSSTYAIVPVPRRVQIGTPGASADPQLSDEAPAERDVGRTIAIGFTEVPAALLRRWPGCPPGVGNGQVAAGRVSWYTAVAFCNWLSREEGLEPCYEPAPGGKYEAGMRPVSFHVLRNGWRLPTEAEWEYAARSGTDGPRFFGRADSLLRRYAWEMGNSDDHPHAVGELRPNDFGLFDVLGNVQEWADDVYSDPYRTGSRLDLGLVGRVDGGRNHVLRGGAYNLPESRLRSAYRFNIIPGNSPGSCGFRLVRTLR